MSTNLIGPTLPGASNATENAKQLTHEEVWDDSALIESWDEALAEYKVRVLSCGI